MTEEAGPLLETIIAASADGLAISDSAGVVVDCNPALCNLVGRQRGEIVGRPLSEFVDVNGHGDRLSKGDTEEVDEGPTRYAVTYCANGLDLIMPVSHVPIRDSADGGYLTIIYIVHANSVQQAQTEFVSTVSHELRTPLTSIKGFADTILRAGDRLDAAQQRRYIGIIKEQADRLTRLVEDLLAVSRLESRMMQLTIRAIPLEEAVMRVVQNLSDKAAKHNVAIKIPPGLPPVWADADRLEQILTNLIDNAIKYSPASTTVTITARSIEPEPEQVEFSVHDQGVGISGDYLSQIFSKFSRQDNPLTRQTEGTGLGLYITKSLILALDGSISVSSTPGNTVFTVRLPAATLEQQAARGRG